MAGVYRLCVARVPLRVREIYDKGGVKYKFPSGFPLIEPGCEPDIYYWSGCYSHRLSGRRQVTYVYVSFVGAPGATVDCGLCMCVEIARCRYLIA